MTIDKFGNLLKFMLLTLFPSSNEDQSAYENLKKIRDDIIIEIASWKINNKILTINTIDITKINDNLIKLINADKQLANTMNKFKDTDYYSNIQDLYKSLAELQALTLLKSIKKKEPIQELIKAIDNKIKTVNSLLKDSLQNKYNQYIDPYYNKYLKYKQKYLALKNN